MSQSTVVGFGLTTFDLEPMKVNPEVTEDITQTLDRLLLWDTTQHHWVPATGNADGALLVTFSAPTTQAPKYGTVLVPAATGIIFNPNPLRKQLLLVAHTDVPIFIGFDAALGLGNGFILNPGSYLSIDNYVGAVYGLTGGVAKLIRYIEV